VASPRRRSWVARFTDAFRGLWRAARTQPSLAVHIAAAAAVIAAAAGFRVAAWEWAALAMAIGLVVMAEVFNTAVESLARGPGSRRHPRLRDALDMSAAAVLVAVATAVALGLIVFGPRLLALG
jgi:diacylglycerol kinase (ATP)